MRLASLDVLRCVAVLLVLCRHSDTPLQSGSWIGVDLFFCLSGFLVSGLLFTEYQKRGSVDIKRFLIRRGFKIYPSFWVMLGVTLLVFGFDNARNLIGELTFTQNYIGRLWNHTWSLAVEEHFYIGLAILVWYTKRFDLIPLLFAFVAIACLLQRLWFAETHGINLFPTNFRIDSLMFGVLISYCWHFKGMRLAEYRWPLLIIGTLMLVPLFFFDSANSSLVFVVGLTWIYLAAGMILVAALNFEAKTLTPLAKIGMYSYSIYLWHMFVRQFIDSSPLFIVVSIIVGIVMGVAIEYPVLKLRDSGTFSRLVASK
jgi:peptidoglycan/LPS O-acetylase OafA/YrhL